MATPKLTPAKYDAANQNQPIAAADKSKGFFAELDNANKAKLSTVRWMVDDPVRAQDTLAKIDRFIDAVDSKRAAFGAIQNHCPEIVHPKGRYIKHSHYKKLMVPLEPFFLPLIL